MAEELWKTARLIPTSGISGAEEQERRATSALLAVMSAVREFGRTMTQPLGAPRGKIETYIEVPFHLQGRKVLPDGLVRVSRGGRTWTALVEVKTGRNELDTEQLEDYLEVARAEGFQALVTVSNQIAANPLVHPTKIDRRKLRKVDLHHLSWSRVLTEAVIQKEHRGVADPDQAWILGELIRYLEHPRSGALTFDDMGPSWVTVREAVASGTLRAADRTAPEVASRFDALLRYTTLQLGRQLGTEVVPALSRREIVEPQLRAQSLLNELVATGTLSGGIRIANAVGPLHVTADLRAGQVTCHVDVDAPREGRPTTRVNWLVRQLRDAPDGARIEAFLAHARGSGAAELLRDVRQNPSCIAGDPKKELRTFRVAITSSMGTKRAAGRGSFIQSVLDAVDHFYGQVVQNLKPWAAAPPRLHEPAEIKRPVIPEQLVAIAMTSEDNAHAATPGHPGSTRGDGETAVRGEGL
ncbi:MAG: stress response protein [Actinomycetes bacterium]